MQKLREVAGRLVLLLIVCTGLAFFGVASLLSEPDIYSRIPAPDCAAATISEDEAVHRLL